jgi:hypothetical protein
MSSVNIQLETERAFLALGDWLQDSPSSSPPSSNATPFKQGCVLVVDDGSTECVRWCTGGDHACTTGLDFFFAKIGVSRILHLHEQASVLQSVERSMSSAWPTTIVLLLTDFLWDLEDAVVKLISNTKRPFHNVLVLSSISELSHIEVQARTSIPESPFSFEGFAGYLASCASQHDCEDRKQPRVSVRDFPAASFSSIVPTSPIDSTLSPHFKPVPITLRQSCVGAFFSNVPRCANVFPLTYADFEREERKRIQRSPQAETLNLEAFRANILGDKFSKVTADRIPSVQRTDYNVLAHTLAGFCQQHDLSVSDSVFAVGFTSRLLARKVVDLNGKQQDEDITNGDGPSATTPSFAEGTNNQRFRRRRKCSLILVDRTVDLFTPTSRATYGDSTGGDGGSHSVPLLDIMAGVLPPSSASASSKGYSPAGCQRQHPCCIDRTIVPSPQDDFGSLDAPVELHCVPELSSFVAKCGGEDGGGSACLSSAAGTKNAASLQLLATLGCKEAILKFHQTLVSIMKSEGVRVPTSLRVVKDNKPAMGATVSKEALVLGFGADTLYRCLVFLLENEKGESANAEVKAGDVDQAECRRRVAQNHKPFLNCILCALEALARVRKDGGSHHLPHLDQLQRMLFEQSRMGETSSSLILQFCDVFNNTTNLQNLGGALNLLILLLHVCAVMGPNFQHGDDDAIVMLQGSLMRTILKMDVESLRQLSWLDHTMAAEIVKIAKSMERSSSEDNNDSNKIEADGKNVERPISSRDGDEQDAEGWDDWSDDEDGGSLNKEHGMASSPLPVRGRSSSRFSIQSDDPSHQRVLLELEERVENVIRKLVDCARYQLPCTPTTSQAATTATGFLGHLSSSLVDPARPNLLQTCNLEHVGSLLNAALQQGGLLGGVSSIFFGGASAVPHPMDNPMVVIFVVGGLTFQEIHTMQAIFSTQPVIAPQDNAESPSFIQIMVGGTCVATGDFIYEKVVA